MADENSKSSFEVSATKYRPRSFDDLAGQEFVVSTLKNSLQSGRIAHAYLFSGPRGCGKTSAARVLARSLNCKKAETAGYSGNPCGVCDNCISITDGSSIDVLEIDGATNKGIDDIRQIKDEVLFPPQTSRYKVYIIDEVHMLSIQAFNALLKTIEEPPPYIVFIFATTELHKVPATIKSRCQQFNFRLIPVETICAILKKICVENKINAEDDALFWIARESTGSMRDALTLFDQVVSFSDGNIRSELIREKLGIIGLEKLNAFTEACAANNTMLSYEIIDEILNSGAAIEQLVIDLAGFYRSLLLLKNGVTRESLLGYRPSLFSAAVLNAYDSSRLERALDILLDCYRNIRYSISPRFELETTVSKLLWLNRWVTPAELKDAIDGACNVLESSASMNNKPSAGGNSRQANASGYRQTQTSSAYKTPPESGRQSAAKFNDNEQSLAASLQRIIDENADNSKKNSASKQNNGYDSQNKTENKINEEDDDVPVWHESNAINNSQPEQPPQLENLMSVIPGVIIN